MKSACYTDLEEVERFSRGRATEEELTRFEEHLLICEACRERLEDVETHAAAIRSAAEELLQDPAPKTSWWTIGRLVPVLAGLVLVIAGAIAIATFTGKAGPPLAVTLVATRGATPGSAVPAGRALAVTPDLTGLTASASYRLEIVNETGGVTWQGSWQPANGPVQVPAQSTGPHFVRIYSGSGELLREYGLDVKR